LQILYCCFCFILKGNYSISAVCCLVVLRILLTVYVLFYLCFLANKMMMMMMMMIRGTRYAQVYFMSPGRETSWVLPLSVALELDADQQDFIRDRVYDFEQRTKRTARARATPTSPGNDSQPSAGITLLPRETTAHDAGYIKPSPSPTVTPVVLASDRPVSVYPPELSATSTARSSASRHTDRVEYMSMNGAKQ